MNDAQRHRGPDADGVWHDEKLRVCFGHRRLSILDLASGGQPMISSDAERVIVFNGEIYNFAELRADLVARGHVFHTHHSDTEVLLNGWREWGMALPEKLNGMWALAILDKPSRTIYFSRDRTGKKPLYLWHRGGGIAFASELQALLAHPQSPRNLSTRALQKYFGYGYIPAPLTLIEGIQKLPAGHHATYQLDSDKLEISKYWDFEIAPRAHVKEADAAEELRHIIDEAVKCRLVADVPVGVFLSGGVDSSTITAFAVKARGGAGLETFSIGFDEPTFDESAYAAQVAKHCGTRHFCREFSLDSAQQVLSEVARSIDEPVGDNSFLPTYMLSRFARERVPVALGGDAGDELFAGYDPFKALRLAKLYQTCVPHTMHEALFWLVRKLPVSHKRMSLDFKLKRTLRGLSHPPRLWAPVWMAPLDQNELRDLFDTEIDLEDLYSEAIAAWDAVPGGSLVDRLSSFYMKLYLQDDILAKVDRMSMAHSLEVRAPLLDIRVIDFARRLPQDLKLRGGVTKYLLKKAMEPLLPREILYRSKQGFGSPVGRWFKDGSLSIDAAALPPALRAEFVSGKIRSHQSGASDERALLWNLWTLQAFTRRQ